MEKKEKCFCFRRWPNDDNRGSLKTTIPNQMTTLAGILCVRNGFELDYNWEISGESLLGVCDELVLSDCESSDGTRERMNEWSARDSRITLHSYPWSNPINTNEWWVDWLNTARQHAKSDAVMFLDADEVLHEDSYETVRRAADNGLAGFCHRYNFWRDAQHLIPEGKCCGHEVLRIGPKNNWFPSDYPDPHGRDADIIAKAQHLDIRIFHYGFLRKREAFFKKAREVQRIWAGTFDPRLEAAEKFEGNWSEMPGVTGWENQLVDFTGTHPKIAHQWLKERNVL